MCAEESNLMSLETSKSAKCPIALVMALCSNARSRVRTLADTSDEFGIGVGVHQGSAPSPLLFVVVMQEAKDEGLWDLLYADDLVITAELEEEAVRKFLVCGKERWKLGD